MVAVDLDLRRRDGAQLVEQLGREAVARERDVRVLEDVGHAPDAVVVLDQRVLLLDLARGRCPSTRRCGPDHLEHVRIRRQREHRHHQAADARRDDEAVGRVREVVQEVAEEERLAVLLQADHRVELGRGLVGQHRAQERRRTPTAPPCRPGSRRGWPRTGARARSASIEQRVDVQVAARRSCLIGTANGRRLQAVDDAADDVRRRLRKNERRQHLDLEVGVERERPRQRGGGTRAADCAGRGGNRRSGRSKPEVEHDVDQRAGAARCARG